VRFPVCGRPFCVLLSVDVFSVMLAEPGSHRLAGENRHASLAYTYAFASMMLTVWPRYQPWLVSFMGQIHHTSRCGFLGEQYSTTAVRVVPEKCRQ
jgi:hypothetical protein